MQHDLSLSHLAALSDYDPKAMPVEQARELIQQFLTPLTATETVSLHTALHRILANDVLSP